MARLTAKARIGRPVLPAEQRKNRNLTFRSRGDLRARLKIVAAESSRSLSEEIEYRLNQSFDHGSLAQAMNRLAAALEQANKPPPLGQQPMPARGQLYGFGNLNGTSHG